MLAVVTLVSPYRSPYEIGVVWHGRDRIPASALHPGAAAVCDGPCPSLRARDSSLRAPLHTLRPPGHRIAAAVCPPRPLPVATMPRRHDIDALRVIALALLTVYHDGLVYVAARGFHVKSDYQAQWLQ